MRATKERYQFAESRQTTQSTRLWAFLAYAIVLLVVVTSCVGGEGSESGARQDTVAVSADVHEMLFGVNVDSLVVEKVSVGRGQTIAEILTAAGLPYSRAIVAADKAAPVFDFRRMRAGNTCYMMREADDTTAHLCHVVYEISPTDYVRLSFQSDSISVAREVVPSRSVRRTTYVSVTSSLWNAMMAENISPQITLDLADIFAWTVDFFGIGQGDEFAIVYDEKRVGEKVVGVGPIWAAVCRSTSKKQYAFRFESDSTSSYFDIQGNSLRRAFLKAPLRYNRISSRFSNGRMHPILKIRRPHHGVDYAAPLGTPVFAIGDGKVTAKGWDSKGGGNYVKIKHNSVYTSEYMHLRGFASGLKSGVTVRQGELIGYVGQTGLATGPHLDFRMFRDGKPVDPLKVDMPPAEPISNDDILDFMDASEKLKSTLDSILTANRKLI